MLHFLPTATSCTSRAFHRKEILHKTNSNAQEIEERAKGYGNEKNEVIALTYSSSASAFSFLLFFSAFAPACEANTLRRSVNLSYCAVSICE